MINIVVVSHSALLARGVEQLARQMMRGDGCKLALAAGVDDEQHPIGTDAVKVMEAIEAVADGDGVLVLMDLGSALLSAETALDLLDPDVAAKVRLCAAPLVEGTLAAVVAANSGASLEQVVAEAQVRCRLNRRSWARPHLRRKRGFAAGAGQKCNLDGAEPARAACAPGGAAGRGAGAVQGRAGAGKQGQCVDPRSLNQLALLQVRHGDTIRLIANGAQADEALAAFKALAEQHFGETVSERQQPSLHGIPVAESVTSGPVFQALLAANRR